MVIRPTLHSLGITLPAAERLLLGTAATESSLGFFLSNPKGIGIYSISAQQHQELWDNYIARDEDLASQVRGFASQHEFLKAPHQELVCNLRYATVIAWVIYQAARVNLQELHSDQDLAACWYSVFAGDNPDQSPENFLASYRSILSDCDQAA